MCVNCEGILAKDRDDEIEDLDGAELSGAGATPYKRLLQRGASGATWLARCARMAGSLYQNGWHVAPAWWAPQPAAAISKDADAAAVFSCLVGKLEIEIRSES